MAIPHAKIQLTLNNFYNHLVGGKTFLSYSFLRIATQVFWFVIPLFVAKMLSQNDFGIFSLSMMLVHLFSALTIKSIIQTPFVLFSNEEYRDNQKANKTFTSIVLLSFVYLAFAIVAVLVFINPITKFASITKYQLLFLALAFLGINLRYFISSLFMCLDKRIEYSVYLFILSFTSALYIVILYFSPKPGLNNILLVFSLPSLAITLFALKKIDFNKFLPFEFNKDHTIDILHYSKWVIVGGAAVYFINWGDNFVLRYYVTLDEIGIYNLGYQIFKGLIEFFIFTSAYFTPFIVRNLDNQRKMTGYLKNKRPKAIAFGILVIISLYITLPWVITLLFGNNYIKAAYVTRILLIGSVFALYSLYYNPILIALKKIKFMQLTSIFFLMFNLFVDYILVSIYGIYGAAIATSLTYFLMCVVYELYFRTYQREILFKK